MKNPRDDRFRVVEGGGVVPSIQAFQRRVWERPVSDGRHRMVLRNLCNEGHPKPPGRGDLYQVTLSDDSGTELHLVEGQDWQGLFRLVRNYIYSLSPPSSGRLAHFTWK